MGTLIAFFIIFTIIVVVVQRHAEKKHEALVDKIRENEHKRFMEED
jgi:preprotein translocase subunit YajC